LCGVRLGRQHGVVQAHGGRANRLNRDCRAHKAKAKTKTAVTFRRETKAFEAGIQAGKHCLITLPGVIASRGGIPILDGGKMIGAVACSGGIGAQHALVAKAGIAGMK
jgi:uncharacterized protein GlcG (DUF336 family)